MADLQNHRINTVTALAERDRTRDELFADLMAMSPEERSRVSPTLFARLTESQLITLMGGELNTMQTFATTSHDVLDNVFKRPRWQRPLPPRLTSWACALVVSTLSGGMAISAMAGGILFIDTAPPIFRSVHARTWPSCPRLAPSMDGCIYRVAQGIDVSTAATLLKMPEATLRAVNPAIPAVTVTLPAGSPLVVWRGRSILTH